MSIFFLKTFSFSQFLCHYRLIMFRKSFYFTNLSNSTWQYCSVEKSVKFSIKWWTKRTFWKLLTNATIIQKISLNRFYMKIGSFSSEFFSTHCVRVWWACARICGCLHTCQFRSCAKNKNCGSQKAIQSPLIGWKKPLWNQLGFFCLHFPYVLHRGVKYIWK